MISGYKLRKTEKSFCGGCGEPVYMMNNSETMTALPIFWICFKCKRIAESGCGVVEIIESDDE